MRIDSSALKELKIFYANRPESSTAKLTVISAYKLGAEEKDMINTFLKKNGLQEVQIREKVEKEVIGGVILVAGSTVIDLSLKGQLTNLKKDLYAIT